MPLLRSVGLPACLLAQAIASLSILACSGSVARARHSALCHPRGAQILASDDAVRVYRLAESSPGLPTTYACLLRGGTSVALGAPNGGCCESIGRIALTNGIVGYASSAIAVDSACTTITVIYVATRSTLLRVPEVACSVDAGIIKEDQVADLVVSPRRSVAWIVSRGQDGSVTSFDVHSAASSSVTAVLDRGPRIDPRSLRLSGHTLSWANAGHRVYSNLR
jgi:hypothetical protein